MGYYTIQVPVLHFCTHSKFREGGKMTSVMMKGVFLLLFATVLETRGKLVNVTLYSESLCPGCAGFLTGPLDRAVREIGSIFTLKYVPWGNAKMISDKKFECQHGPMECTMNIIEACVIHYYPKRDDFFPFLVCLDKELDRMDPAIGKKCAEKNNILWDKIESCYTGDLGYKLEVMYAEETSELKPPHEYVPWVTINGKHDARAEGDDLIMQICEAYTGTKPPKCSEE